MDRQYYLDLAASGLSMPIATDLLLHEQPDPQAVLLDGRRLGQVVRATAERIGTPLAVPLMDLRIEKQAIAMALGLDETEHETFHFDSPPTDEQIEQVVAHVDAHPTPRMTATCQAIAHVAGESDLLPIGMCIGPFSLATKLMTDPIMPAYMLGLGDESDPEAHMMIQILKLTEAVVQRYVAQQARAGAKAMFCCEPAANRVYLSPNQMSGEGDIFDRCAIEPLRRLCDLMRQHEVDLILHDCGELTDEMVERLAALEPAILSLGGSRVLWEDARLVPDHVVLYGNLPSKQFYDDHTMPPEKVSAMAAELVQKMKTTGQPFILGTECDVLCVAGSEARIRSKAALLHPRITANTHRCAEN